MNRLILYVSFSCLLAIPVWSQSLSWPEALEQMQNYNQKLKGVEKQTEAAAQGKKTYQGLYLPQLSLNASYLHLADPLSLSFNDYKAPLQTEIGGVFRQLAQMPLPPLQRLAGALSNRI